MTWTSYKGDSSQTLNEVRIAQICDDVGKLDFREERALRDYLATCSANEREVLERFVYACYHIVGTSVVNCETGTDLSQLAAAKLDDLTLNDPGVLSETNVFLRLCFGTAMHVVNQIIVPSAVIDAIPLDRIDVYRRALQNQGFQDKYDEIIRTFVEAISAADSGGLEAWQPEATLDLVNGLREHFRRYLQEELAEYRTLAEEHSRARLVRAGADTLKGVVSDLLPGAHTVVNIYEFATLAKDGIDTMLEMDPAILAADAREARAAEEEKILAALQPKNRGSILMALREMRRLSALSIRPD